MTTDAVPAPSAPEQRAVRPPRWYRLGIADVVLLMLVGGLGQQATGAILRDPGLGWHLRTPELIFATGTWPTTDPFSGPSAGKEWLANQWLGDIPLWLGWKLAGLNGIAAVALAFLMLTYRLLYGFLRADGVPWPAAGLWTFTAALASYYAWMARPNLVTFLAVTILARVLILYHEGRLPAKRLWWLLPLFAVWANSHGGFIIGLVMLAVATGTELLPWFAHDDAMERQAAKKRFTTLILSGVGCVLATLVNPYGVKLYPWVLSLLGNKYFMNLHTEWLSPDFHSDGSTRFAVFMVGFPVLFALSQYRPKLTPLAMGALWLYLAFQSGRYVPLWIVVATPLLARAAMQIDWLNAKLPRGEMLEFYQLRANGWLGLILIVLGLGVWVKVATPLQQNPKLFPVGVQELFKHWQPGEVVLNQSNFGGTLTLHGYPDVLIWLDDRNEVHGQARYEEYFAVERTNPGWEEQLTKWNPDWVVIPPDCALAYRLTERPQRWDVVHRDDLVVLFRKKK